MSLSRVSGRGIDSDTLPNAIYTGGSSGSETSAEAARLCAEKMAKKLKPFVTAAALKNGADTEKNWEDGCFAAKMAGIHLSESILHENEIPYVTLLST